MTPKKLGIFLVLLVLVGSGVSALFYTAYKLRNHQEFLSDIGPQVEKIEKAKGKTITLTETKEGNRKWVLKMREIKYSQDNTVASLIDINGLVYGDDEKILFAFKADNGEFYKEDARVVLKDGAKIIFPTNEAIVTAKQMDWSSDSGMVKATGGVQMMKQNFGTSRAREALFAMDFSKIQFTGNVTSIIGSHTNAGDQN